MSKPIQRISLFAGKDGTDVIDILHSLQLLLADYQVTWEASTAQLANLSDVDTIADEHLGRDADLIIVIGGDGSILRCATAAMQHQTPMIGINKGRLGFLTDIRPNELDSRLLTVLQGDYWKAERFLLQTTIDYADGTQRDCCVALNDVILYPGETPHMMDFEVFIDDEFLCSHRADGLIIATPTGSTAYNLSAGGPIIHPSINALVMLPMFSHSLTARPIIIPSDKTIRVEFSPYNKINGKLSSNMGDIVDVLPGANIMIQQAKQKITLLHPLDYDYYESLRSKLHWGQRITD